MAEDYSKQTGESSINQPYDGVGEYVAFTGQQNSGSTYTPPTTLNPFFVSPAYSLSDYGELKVYLASDETAEFFEDEKSLGFFQSNKLLYSPAINFGTRKVYKSVVKGKTSLNYYEVVIDKTYKNIYDTSVNQLNLQSSNFKTFNQDSSLFDFNYSFTNENGSSDLLTRQDILYKENVKIIEFLFDPSTKTYLEDSERNLDSTSGTINLNFRFAKEVKVDGNPLPNTDPLGDQLISYDVKFLSNFKTELGDILKLKYEILSQGDDVLGGGTVSLKTGGTDKKQIKQSLIKNGLVRATIEGQLPKGFSIKNIYYANNQIAKTYQNDYSKWKDIKQYISFDILSGELAAGLVVLVLLEKESVFDKPSIKIKNSLYDVEVKESDKEKGVSIEFLAENTDYVNVYLAPKKFIKVDAKVGFVDLYFSQDFNGEFGAKKIILVPVSEQYGTGDTKEIIVKFVSVNDFPSITQISFPELIEIPSFSDLKIDYDVEYNSFSATSVDVDLIVKDGSRIPLFKSLSANGAFSINLKTLGDKYPTWNGKDNITLILKPYNRAGDRELIGNEYEIITKLTFPSIQLDEDSIRKTLYDAFDKYLEKITLVEPEKESKYLTHLANFGNDEQIVISTWENDNYTLSDKGIDAQGNEVITNEVNSIILKLYEPLPTEYDKNTTFWVTKLVTNSIVETVILTEEAGLSCPVIKGPNFNIDVDFVTGKSTNYESLDNLILSSSISSSEQLVNTYLSSSLIDFNDINIQYVSGSTYLWNNFVHFSSAKERVDNFVYKVQLIETYESLIASASTDIANPSASLGYPTAFTASLASQQEAERNRNKKQKLIQGFDGFESFLYSSSSYTTSDSSSMTWPYSSGSRMVSTDNVSVLPWYNSIIALAEDYDDNNNNFILNNIPQYIKNDENNDHFTLFFTMIGQYFDTFYYYTKAIENSRQLGYKDNGELANKLIYDYLLSMGWDAKHISVDSKLWKYAFGLDDNGDIIETNPAKRRTFEIWRRIINNLPYLLKNKGTRRGINALLSCYGIPSSNLSIFEFGGPNVESTLNTGKFEMENLTYMLNMVSGSYVNVDWNNTDRNRKPDTIELFVKPAYSNQFTLISGSGWNLQISGSSNSYYGKVKFNFLENGASKTIESALLPIFNDKTFGVEISRYKQSTSSSYLYLNTFQTDKDKIIISSSVQYQAINTNWESGSVIKIGGLYSGSIDEFRLWSTPLNEDKFKEHVFFPEMVNGNHFSSSTEDLVFRLDFEYPKNLGASNPTRFINVAPNIKLSGSLTRNSYEDSNTYSAFSSTNVSASFTASAFGFSSISDYPYNYLPIERNIVVSVPDGITSRYSNNKVRFEEQTLISDLSSKSRSTIKSFDNAPMDSNRVGVFFSPNKELNIDIAKSFGDFNLGDYIGDPSDKYKDTYKDLNKLRGYYFQRFQKRNIFAYLNIVSLYEKSLFDDLKKMMPARVKPTTGILIEPHFLERSRIRLKKPSGDTNDNLGEINYNLNIDSETSQNEGLIIPEVTPSGENYYYETEFTPPITLISDNLTYSSTVGVNDEISLQSENASYNTTIATGLEKRTYLPNPDYFTTVVGIDDYDTFGFGIYAESGGFAVHTYKDKDNIIKKRRVRVCVIKEEKTITTTKYKVLLPDGTGDPRGGVETTSSVVVDTKLNIQPYTGSNGLPTSLPSVTGSVIGVTPVKGYLKVHHRYTKDTTIGLENSYFRGSKNKSTTTIDGTEPVEIFATNPNTLVVNKAGRSSSEPILEVQ